MASFSNRVPMRRHSLSQPMHCSMMLRLRYESLSNFVRSSRASFSLRGMTGVILCWLSHSRIRRQLYALSPARANGRVRGRPTGCGTRTRFMSDSRRVDSWTSPGLTSTARGRPVPSVTRCSLLPNPPRERPNAWSRGSSAPPFSRPRRPPVRPAPSSRPRTISPSRCAPPHPAAPAAPTGCGRTRRVAARS